MRTLYMISLCLITGLYLSTVLVAQGCNEDGFFPDGHGGCIDENECDSEPCICGEHGYCHNTHGSYYCSCLEGFYSSKENFTVEDYGCKDINECLLKGTLCGPDKKCKNTVGSFKCVCRDGYRKEDQGNEDCNDVDECVESPLVCGPNGTCTNKPGSYTCTCPPGFRNHDNNNTATPCEDADECEDPVCGHPYGTCTNTPGSYTCSCQPGFHNQGNTNNGTCEDVDECKEKAAICGPNSTCTNLNGSYTCSCVEGFKVSTVTGYCEVDDDECAAVPAYPTICGEHARCINTKGSYYCECEEGYQSPKGPKFTADDPKCQELVTTLKKDCQGTDVDCELDFLKTLVSISLPATKVASLLDVLLDSPPDSLASRGDAVLQATEDLVSTLAKPTLSQSSTSFITNTTEVKILSVGPNTSLTAVPKLVTVDVSVDIDLLGIADNNNGSASVGIIVYNNMHKALNDTFFKTPDNKTADMISKVVSVILPNTLRKTLSTPMNISIPHLENADAEDEVLCVHWEANSWIQDGCHVSITKSTHTVCSCQYPSTFALIMTMDPTQKSDPVMSILNTILVLIGLLFLTLAVMTFALYRWNPRVSNVARLNLCVCLLLAHTLFLLTQSFLRQIRAHQALCKTLAGVLHYLFLCSFVWMFIEAVMLFLSVRKLRQVKPSERAWLQWKVSLPIGYGIPLIIVGVSAGVNPEGHGSGKCWLVEGFKWSFLGPVCFLLAVNTILFLTIIITIQSTLKEARSDVSKVKYTRVLLFKLTVQFLILGCPWLLGMGASTSRVLEVLFLFLTSQQGTAIFLIHCLLNTEVRFQYRKWWQRLGPSRKQPESATGTGLGAVSLSLTQQPSKDS